MKKEVKIGLFGIAALIVLVMGINFLKGLSVFHLDKVYYVSFRDAKGIAKSSHVFADGVPVGRVSDLIYNFRKPGEILVKVSLDPRLVLPGRTTAVIETSLMGAATMSLILGRDSLYAYHPGDTIPGSENIGMMERVGDVMPDVHAVIRKVDTLITTVNRLLSNPHLEQILVNADQITSDLTVTTKQLNRLMENDIPKLTATYTEMGHNMNTFVSNLNRLDLQQTMASVNKTLKDVDQMVLEIQNPNGTLGALIKDRELYSNINHTVQSADSLVTDLKAHPKRYVHFSVFGRKDK
jgi:phospholipid/cholesterol/gamma-HCH transport system substrate-binding protein